MKPQNDQKASQLCSRPLFYVFMCFMRVAPTLDGFVCVCHPWSPQVGLAWQGKDDLHGIIADIAEGQLRSIQVSES